MLPSLSAPCLGSDLGETSTDDGEDSARVCEEAASRTICLGLSAGLTSYNSSPTANQDWRVCYGVRELQSESCVCCRSGVSVEAVAATVKRGSKRASAKRKQSS